MPVDKYVLSTMTAPVLVAGVSTPSGPKDMLFILGANNVVFALDANSGQILWQKSYPNPASPLKPKEWLCPGTPNDTPTIDKARGVVFFITGDGVLRGLNLADGAERLAPVPMTAPFARAWSLNLIDNVLYSTSGRACGEVSDKSQPGICRRHLGPAPRRQWSAAGCLGRQCRRCQRPRPSAGHRISSSAARVRPRPGAAAAPRARPAASCWRPATAAMIRPSGDFSESILKVSPKAARLMDSYTPTNWMDNLMHDMSGSATPVVFNFAGKTLVAASQKEAVLRILDAANLGGPNHMTPLWQSPKLGNDEKTGTDPSRGVWGAIATYENNGHRYLYLPLYGHPSKDAPVFPITNGPREDGSVMAFEVKNDGGKISADAGLDLHQHDHARSAGGGEWRGLCALDRRPGDAEHGPSRREAHDL